MNNQAAFNEENIVASNCIAYAFWQCYDSVAILRTAPEEHTLEEWDAIHLEELKTLVKSYVKVSSSIKEVDEALNWVIKEDMQQKILGASTIAEIY